ncbi:hypothetical protein EDC94DRAFT_604191 [Helicostylum pulchrum]|nr:hypothetical protein EDC94DRAFT_604191 [Helicostylum pulchrum]
MSSRPKLLDLVFFLKKRHLSVRGSGLVANTILLSRVWHILRVVLVPPKWIKDIRSIVSQFVLPFGHDLPFRYYVFFENIMV